MNQEKIEYLECPRCKQTKLHPDEVMNSLSRKDNETYICSDCGVQEAIEEFEKMNLA